jgi:hypothetical protein
LSATSSQSQRFSSTAFFPANGMMFGNEGNTNNYHFTYQLGSNFIYQSGKSFYISIESQDDMWLFVNNKLVGDLGGVHTNVGSVRVLLDR